MRFEVSVGSEEEFKAAIDMPSADSGQTDYTALIKENLLAAEAEGAGLVCFKSVEPGAKSSESFQRCMFVENPVMDFLKKHERPETVRIVCNDSAIEKVYKVVYNFYFAATKAARIEDERWD